MSKIDRYKAGFKKPDRRYAIYPILHGNSFEKETIETLDRRGFAGVVGNVPYTKDFPNDQPAWDKAINGFREYIDKGMHAWIYDEDGYPSGSARGHVTETHPEFIAQGLYCYKYWRVLIGPRSYRSDIPDAKLYRAVLVPADGKGDPVDITSSLNENNVLYFDIPEGKYYLFIMSIRRLFDGTHATQSWSEPRNYISLSDKEATKAFIQCTHENYKKRLSDEFGKGILAMFTDEPSLIAWQITAGVFPILPWLHSYPKDFEARYGYDFMLACVAVALEVGQDVVKRRCDFWEFIADTVAEGYFASLQDWCHENNLKASGHMLREESLQAHVYNYGSFYRAMKKFDWPGIDQLEVDIAPLMNDSEIPIARFIASFADISGEREVFTEFQDLWYRFTEDKIAGIECYYNTINWHLAMGVNNFTSYASYKSLTDEQIYDINQYTARSGYLLRQGIRDSRIGIFYPEATMWADYILNCNEDARDDSERMVSLEKTFAASAWELLHRQVDFDYVDFELLLNGVVKDGKLTYRDRAYSVIVMPGTRVLQDAVAARLIELAENGITVMFCYELPTVSRETGLASPYAEKIAAMIKDGKMFHEGSIEKIGDFYDACLPDKSRSIRVLDKDGNYNHMILSHCRVTEDGSQVVYITNMGEAVFTGTLSIVGDFAEVFEANSFTGDIAPVAFTKDGDSVTISVSIEPGEGRFYLV
ncbi:MAG: hypothetical protein E7402_03740 [Ruminococcaceae bacterium]|nr:hypothetical protein [Oscillospiraceae bacterium]